MKFWIALASIACVIPQASSAQTLLGRYSIYASGTGESSYYYDDDFRVPGESRAYINNGYALLSLNISIYDDDYYNSITWEQTVSQPGLSLTVADSFQNSNSYGVRLTGTQNIANIYAFQYYYNNTGNFLTMDIRRQSNGLYQLSGFTSFDGQVGSVGDQYTRNTFVMDDVRLNLSTLPVPEPASWALLIAGFGTVGASLRARRKVQVLA